jgi:hypothetical protein
MRALVRTFAAALAAAALAGCAGTSGHIVSDGGLYGSVTIGISATTANVIGAVGIIGLLAAANDVTPVARPLPMLEDRTINEQDCTRPIASTTANLRCR